MNSDAIKKMNEQIEVDKEVLSVLPKNNKKNLNIYKEKAAEIKTKYEYYLKDVVLEMKRRSLKVTSIKKNQKIEEIEKELDEFKNIIILNEKITSFEKMGLDEILFVQKRFYKNNLELINESIVECLEKFKKVGINLKNDDFNYSVYTKEYMKVFFNEMRKGDINSTEVKENFEQIYWKCSDIIMQIELNFRCIYLRYEKDIDKFYENEKKEFLKELGLTEKEVYQKFKSLKNRLIKFKEKDTALIIEKFINKDEVPKDYEKMSIKNVYKKLVKDDFDECEEEQIDEINKNIARLKDNLFEYKNYMNYKFIYDNIMEIYNSEEKYKSIVSQKLKQISKVEGQLFKINKRIESRQKHSGLILRLFNKFKKNNNKLEDINTDVNSKINELKDLYAEYEEAKVKNIIVTELNKNSTIYDALYLTSSFYGFLVDSVIKNFEDIQQEEIQMKIDGFRDFIQFPNITIINNIKIVEEKDIVLAIKDKYNLCNINVTVEDLDLDNIDKIMTMVKNICMSIHLESCKVTLDDIKYVLQASKILGEDTE